MSDVSNQLNENRLTQTSGAEPGIQFYQKQIELLYYVAQVATSYHDIEKLIRKILQFVQHILKAAASSLLLLDKEKGELYFLASEGSIANKLRQVRTDLHAGIAGWVARNGVAVVSNDVAGDSRFNRDMDDKAGFVTRSMIAMPLFRGRKIIGVLEVLNKNGENSFTDDDLTILGDLREALILLVSMTTTAINNIKLRQTLIDEQKYSLEALALAAEARDPNSYGHSRRVRKYALMAAESLSIPQEELEIIGLGALLHDIGKTLIGDIILNRSGELNSEERYVIKKHPLKGAGMVSAIPFLEESIPIILYHHEWYDGTGYPEGLKGNDIPLGARIVAVAEAFDAMTTELAHSPAISPDEAINELNEHAGRQFCPVAVNAFISAFKKSQSQEG